MAEPELKILLIEDSEEDVFFFRRALSKTAIRADVKVIADGKTAAETIVDRKQSFDLVFLDLKLPKLSGFDVLQQLQGRPISERPNIVVLSGSAHEKDKLMAEQLGVTNYVVKPITPDVLRQHLASLRTQ